MSLGGGTPFYACVVCIMVVSQVSALPNTPNLAGCARTLFRVLHG